MKTNANKMKSILSFLLCAVLIATMALCVTGCKDTQTETPKTETPTSTGSYPLVEKGEGNTVFTFAVTDHQGNFTYFQLRTNQTIVGEALEELELISGEEGPYGLYVKTVNGITLDYDKDGYYWAFYENGSYALTGVDKTPLDPNKIYEFRALK